MATNITVNIRRGQLTRDAGWNESEHKRDHGQFASTGGGGAAHEKHDWSKYAGAHASATGIAASMSRAPRENVTCDRRTTTRSALCC